MTRKTNKPCIYIPRNLMTKIQFYVDNCDKEISGMGTVELLKDRNAYLVTDIKLIKQTVTGTTTDLDEEATAIALYEHAISGKAGEFCFWWHSHVNMQTFWSSTDIDTIEKLGGSGLCVATVHNKSGSVRGAIKECNQKGIDHLYDDVTVTVIDNYDFNTEEALAEMKELVVTKVYAPTTYSSLYNKSAQSYSKKKGGTRRALSIAEQADIFYDEDDVYAEAMKHFDSIHESSSIYEKEMMDNNPLKLTYELLRVSTDFRNKKTKEYYSMTLKARESWESSLENYIDSEADIYAFYSGSY